MTVASRLEVKDSNILPCGVAITGPNRCFDEASKTNLRRAKVKIRPQISCKC